MAQRTVRNLTPATKSKISAAQKRNHAATPMSDATKAKISAALKKYWAGIPYANPETSQENNKEEKTDLK